MIVGKSFLDRHAMRVVCTTLQIVVLLFLLPHILPAAEVARPMEVPRTDIDFLLNLARSGKVEAQLLLGEYYHARHEYAEAMPWLRLAAEQGAVEAQRRLALMYEAGQGVPRDDEQAAFWLHCAAAQGDPLAFYKEGFSYATSAGIP
jgi:TPR repeat protein